MEKELRIYYEDDKRDTWYAGEWDAVEIDRGNLIVSEGEAVLAVYAAGCWLRYYIEDDNRK